MDQDELPAEDMAVLREAVMGYYEDSVMPLVGPRSRQVPRVPRRPRRRPPWLKLLLLLLPVLLMGLVRWS